MKYSVSNALCILYSLIRQELLWQEFFFSLHSRDLVTQFKQYPIKYSRLHLESQFFAQILTSFPRTPMGRTEKCYMVITNLVKMYVSYLLVFNRISIKQVKFLCDIPISAEDLLASPGLRRINRINIIHLPD